MGPVETIEYRGYTIEIHRDENAENPLKAFGCEPTLILHEHAERYFGWSTDEEWVGKLQGALEEIAERGVTQRLYGKTGALAIVARWMRVFHHIPVVLPVYVYEHSGTTCWVGDDDWSDTSDRWDSGWVGWFFATPEQLAEWGTPPELVEQLLRSSFSEFTDYVEGQVYGYVITAPDGEDVGSCWGFYGSDAFDQPDSYAYQQCVAEIDGHIGPVLFDERDTNNRKELADASS